jgi:hypothetical protein
VPDILHISVAATLPIRGGVVLYPAKSPLTEPGNVRIKGGDCYELDIGVLCSRPRPIRSAGPLVSAARRLAPKRQLITYLNLAPGFCGLEPGYA